MLSRIFPTQIDNAYQGRQLAVWFLTLFLLVKAFASVTQMDLNPFLSNREILQDVEGVPLDTFSAGAANAALVLFAWWGVAGLMLTVLGLIAVIRYRAMIPLIYLLTAITKIGETAIAEISPVVGMLGAGASMPLIGIGVLLLGFGLSVTPPRKRDGG